MALTDQADGFVIADAVKFEPEASAPESATWTPALSGPARFDVHARWTAHANRSASANYVLTHQGGTTVVTRNQQTNGGAWNLLGTFTFAPGQGVRLEASEAGYVIADALRFTPASDQPTSGGLFYVHPDHLGTPRAITRPNDNALVWRWENAEPFGNSLPDENPSGMGAFAYNLRFPGQYYDAETGTHYNYFRDYDAALGRYTQSDPIGLKGGLNTYLYVLANPIKRSDRRGLDAYDPNWPPNPSYDFDPQGNLFPGWGLGEGQDMVCTLPSIIGAAANANKCIVRCCQTHDLCFRQNRCNMSSWFGNFMWLDRDCQRCNTDARRCIVSAITKGCSACE